MPVTPHSHTDPQLRSQLVKGRPAHAGTIDPRVAEALDAVPRESFVPEPLRRAAREDGVLPLEDGQSMLPVSVLARAFDALQLTAADRVLEVGTGSGYGAAVLARIAAEVYTLEIRSELAESARRLLLSSDGSAAHIHVICADGTLGWPGAAPYDAIVVHAAAPKVPFALLGQLAIGGRLVIPLGMDLDSQVLMRFKRRSRAHYAVEALGAVRVPPLDGSEGWPASRGTDPRGTL